MEEREAVSARSSTWARPPLIHRLISQIRRASQLEIDYVIRESHKELLPGSSGQTAIIRIVGVTREGHSVCCYVHGFEPYFYIACPPGMGLDDISQSIRFLRMRESNKNASVPHIEMVQKRSIMYYQQQKSQTFLKITVALPTIVASCRGMISKCLCFVGLLSHLLNFLNAFIKLVGILDRGIHIVINFENSQRVALNLQYLEAENINFS